MGRRILIADDEADIRDSLRIMLETRGYQVRTCSNGEAVLPALYDYEPELLILDVMLPGIDGLTVLSMITKEGGAKLKDLRVIVISALGPSEHVFAQFPHVTSFLAKPFDREDILKDVKAALQEP